GGSATLLIHHTDLQGEARQVQQVLHSCEQLVGEGNLLRAVLLRLHDVDRAGTGVAVRVLLVQALDRSCGGDDGIHDALEDLLTIGIQDRRVLHQVANVTDEQQGTTLQAQLGAVLVGVVAVLVEGTGEGLAVLLNFLGEVADIQAEPVAVAQGLVGGGDGRDEGLEVHDRGDSGLHEDVLHTGIVGLDDRGFRIDLDLDVQAVVTDQDAGRAGLLAGVACVDLRVAQVDLLAVDLTGDLTGGHGVLGDVLVGAGLQRNDAVQELTTPLDDLVATDLVVAAALLLAVLLGDGIGAVEGIVQGAPASVRRIQGEAGVENRDDQLRAGGLCDLELAWLVDQVTDLAEEGLVFLRILSALVVGVPLVELGLQLIALGQQLLVARGELLDDLAEAIPELLLVILAGLTSLRKNLV